MKKIFAILAVVLMAAFVAPSLAQTTTPKTITPAEALMADVFGMSTPVSGAPDSIFTKFRAELGKNVDLFEAYLREKSAVVVIGGKTEKRLSSVEAAISAYDAALMALVPDSLSAVLSAGLPGQPNYGDLLAAKGQLKPELRKAGLGNVARKSDVDELSSKLDEILDRLPPNGDPQ